MHKPVATAIITWLVVAFAGGCVSVPSGTPATPPVPQPERVSPLPPGEPPPPEPPEQAPAPGDAPLVQPPQPQPPAVPAGGAPLAYSPVDWTVIPGWSEDSMAQALPVLLNSCLALKDQQDWQSACSQAAQLRKDDNAAARRFFEGSFVPYVVTNAQGETAGLVTGYYEPLLHGSRTPTRTARYPLYGVPDDLLSVDLGEQHPELKGLRLRGRLQGRKIVPYYTRAEIERGDAPVRGREILWVDDPVELFFLQIQGSGRVKLADGEIVRVGYAEHNGHPYKSIGRVLIERGEISPEKASMQGIKQWAQRNPDLLPLLLQQNPAYVFFRELPGQEPGPIGSLGVSLTPGRSLAVDPTAIPLGAPVFLSSTWPLSTRPLNRLMLAQDTGSAIKGAARVDFFWGFGDEAGALAGRMRQQARLWLLYPKGMGPRLP